jgi:hypothetical protein
VKRKREARLTTKLTGLKGRSSMASLGGLLHNKWLPNIDTCCGSKQYIL